MGSKKKPGARCNLWIPCPIGQHPRLGDLHRRCSWPLSTRPRQAAYIERVLGIPHLIRPSRGGGSGEGHPSSGGASAPVAARPTPPFCPAGGPSGHSVAGGAAGGGGSGSSPPRGGGGPSFRQSGGSDQTWGEAELRHTCSCPRCVVHYETCIQSLMAQEQDLRAQSLELQRCQQESSQAVASTAGISHSYADWMPQILSTWAKFDAVVQGYQRDSKAVEASMLDYLKTSNSNTAKCFSAVEMLATCYAAVASRIDACDHWYSRPAEPDTMIHPRHRHLHPFLILSRLRLRRPWARHPVHSGVVVSFLSQSMHPAIASTIRTLVRTRGGQGEGRSTTKTHITKNLLRGGKPPKSRRNLLSPSGGRRLRAKNPARSLRHRGPVRRRTPLRWGTSIPSRKMFSIPRGHFRTRPLILRTRVQFLQ